MPRLKPGEVITIDLTEDRVEEKRSLTEEEAKKRRERVSRRLEWLGKMKKVYWLKSVESRSKNMRNRVEIADAHSTNYYETHQIVSDNEGVGKNQNCVDSTVVPESTMDNFLVWQDSFHGTSEISTITFDKCSSTNSQDNEIKNHCGALWASHKSSYNSLLNESSGEKHCVDNFDLEMPEEPVILNRVSHYDSILTGGMSMLDEQSILEDSSSEPRIIVDEIEEDSKNEDLDCLVDFHLPSIDSPPSDSLYSSVRSVDPRLTRKTWNIEEKLTIMSDLDDLEAFVSPGVSSTPRKRDSLLNGAKNELVSKGTSFESKDDDHETKTSRSLENDSYESSRREIFRLSFIDNNETAMSLRKNILQHEQMHHLLSNDEHKKPHDAHGTPTTRNNSSLESFKFHDNVDPCAEKIEQTTKDSIVSIHQDLQPQNPDSIVFRDLSETTKLSNVSSTTAYYEYLLLTNESDLLADNDFNVQSTIPSGVMIQVPQVSSPDNKSTMKKLQAGRVCDNYELTTQQSSTRRSPELLSNEDSPPLKRRKEVNSIVIAFTFVNFKSHENQFLIGIHLKFYQSKNTDFFNCLNIIQSSRKQFQIH